jgi:hypothetical protein
MLVNMLKLYRHFIFLGKICHHFGILAFFRIHSISHLRGPGSVGAPAAVVDDGGVSERGPAVDGAEVDGALRGAGRVSGAARGAGGVDVAARGAGRINGVAHGAVRRASGVVEAACGRHGIVGAARVGGGAARGVGKGARRGAWEGRVLGSDSMRESRSVGGEEPTRGNTSSSKTT